MDDTLYKIKRKLNLGFLKPLNVEEEKQRFFDSGEYNPQFQYNRRSFTDDLETLKSLEPDDTPLGNLYKKAIQELGLRLKMYESIGKPEFTEYSRSIFGAPDKNLVNRAKLLMENVTYNESDRGYSAEEAVAIFKKEIKTLGFKWNVITDDVVANAYVIVPERTLIVRKDMVFSQEQIDSFIAHEIYTHIVRAECGFAQPYKLLTTGTAGYETTEEGLALYNEELSGVLDQSRLMRYAGRVLAIKYALNGSFRSTFVRLREFFSPEQAWKMTLRAKRGVADTSQPGAFTKDTIYYWGYLMVKEHMQENDLKSLYYGKVGVNDLEHLGDEKILEPNDVFKKIFKGKQVPARFR